MLGVVFPAPARVVRLELHFAGEKVDCGFLVFVYPTMGQRERSHEAHHQRAILFRPRFFDCQGAQLVFRDRIDEPTDNIETRFSGRIIERNCDGGRGAAHNGP